MGTSVIGSLDPQVWKMLGLDIEKQDTQPHKEKIVVTGKTGQLGYDVCKELKQRNMEYVGASTADFDITDEANTREYMLAYTPTVVIHCSAYTAVDKAEDEVDKCFAVNESGTRNIAKICKKLNCKMIYISSDYVFPGTGKEAYEVNDGMNPQNIYGKSKQQGELAVKEFLDKYFIVRISWVFGENGNNFIKTMLKVGKDKEEINVVSDQIGSPTYTADLAKLLCDMAETENYGVYHATNEGFCSWAEFAEEIFKATGYNTKVNHITTEQYPTKAQRPKNSRLSKLSLKQNGFEELPDWQDAVKRYVSITK